jgi:tetratricopeptide (TPR) repeat protein
MTSIFQKKKKMFPIITLLISVFLPACGGDKQNAKAPDADTVSAKNATPSIEKLNGMIEQEPENAQLHYERALAYYEFGDLALALTDFDKTISLEPEFASAYHDRGICRFELTRFQEAMDDFNRAVQLDPEYSEAYFNRSLVWDELDEPEKALADLDKAIAINPEFGDAYYNRAVYRLNSDREKSCADFKKASDLGIREAELTYGQYCKP